MSDTLILHQIATQCRLGVFEWEQENPQTVWIDLELAIDTKKISVSDKVSESVDYAKVVLTVNEIAGGDPFKLIETLAETIASEILKRFSTPAVKVRIQKRALAGLDHAAVEIHRTRSRARGERTRRTGRLLRVV